MKDTKHLKLHMKGKGEKSSDVALANYSDADYAARPEIDHGRSVTARRDAYGLVVSQTRRCVVVHHGGGVLHCVAGRMRAALFVGTDEGDLVVSRYPNDHSDGQPGRDKDA